MYSLCAILLNRTKTLEEHVCQLVWGRSKSAWQQLLINTLWQTKVYRHCLCASIAVDVETFKDQSEPRPKHHRAEMQDEDKCTYCFLREVIGQILLALVLGVSFLRPSNHAWKTQTKHPYEQEHNITSVPSKESDQPGHPAWASTQSDQSHHCPPKNLWVLGYHLST